MLRSMTGYGKARAEKDDLKLSIEIKTVNSKQMDMNCRLPYDYNEKEPEIRSIAGHYIQRGKVYLGITRESTGEESARTLNQKLALRYFNEMKTLIQNMHLEKEPDYLQAVIRMPDVFVLKEQELKEEEWKLVKDTLNNALQELDEYRIQEGAILQKDFRKRIDRIKEYLEKLVPYEQERLKLVKDKFDKELSDFLDNKTIDENRYEQEIVYYLDKLDITEEKVRLKQHCDYFLETMNTDTANGKKLNFIVQEMGREINTTGSKANHSAIQKIVVEMKDELEKIKEQLANIL
ncbi:MAG: YicC family protein [Bacteroidales bacterium]|nr:YicC family protein [Bacteroidales bacterium]